METRPPVSRGPLAKVILSGVILALLVAFATGTWALVNLVSGSGSRIVEVAKSLLPEPGTPAPARSEAPTPPAIVATPVPPGSPRPEPKRPPAGPLRPTYTDRDAGLSPEQAFLELWAALDSGDAATAAKFVLAQKLSDYDDADAVLADLQAISASDLRVEQAKRKGDRAVLFVGARSSAFTDAEGRTLAAPAVIRMVREDRHWKLFSQLWLINSDLAEPRREALAWLEEDLAGQGKAAEARRQLAARGLTADAEALVSATVRHQVDSIDLLLAAGVSPNARAGDMSAWEHVMIGLGGEPVTEQIAITMVAAGADLGYLTPTRMGPLALAVSSCRLELVEVLLRAGAKPDAVDGHGLTPLRWAQQSCPAAVGPLKKAGAR